VNADGGGEHVAARVAAQQLELITAEQLRVAGVGRGVIHTRRRQGTLRLVHTGVYLVGSKLMLPGAWELAAVLACGQCACARRRSAASLLGVADPWDGDVEVVVPGRNRRSRDGIAVERVAVLGDIDRGFMHGIPITSPARTLLDFAVVATRDELERAIAEAYALKLVTEPELREVLGRHPHRAGVARLRAELDRVGGPLWTASKAERVMKDLLRKAELPTPQTQVRVAGYPADFLWPQYRLIVEVDGYQFHGHRYAFERDHKRDQAHKSAKYEVIRFTWRNLVDEPYRVVAVIAMAIEAAK
jgi:very-short-patch-repair endonuclease